MLDEPSSLKYFDGTQLTVALEQVKRVYMTGNLQSSQETLEHFADIAAEAGMSGYAEYTGELPHIHTFNTEFNFVVKGKVKVLLPVSGEEHELGENSLFIIEPNMPYCTKAQSGSRVLFFKAPGGNDKQLIPVTPSIEHWLSSWDAGWDDS